MAVVDSTTKCCTKCHETKPTTEFGKDVSKRDGLNYYCKACCRIADAKWRSANKDKHKARVAAWVAANPDKERARHAKWRANNPEKSIEYGAKWRAANPEKQKAATSKWREANHDRHKANYTKWVSENQEAVRINNQNYRARKLESGGKLSAGLAERLYKLQRGKCACGCKKPLGDDYHLDHIMPLALGGTHTDDNIQLLRATCNQRKHAKHPIDFMQQRGFLL